jgi:hypothetical protein
LGTYDKIMLTLAIVEHFESTPWREPWTVQLFVQEQDYARVWMLRDGVAELGAAFPWRCDAVGTMPMAHSRREVC